MKNVILFCCTLLLLVSWKPAEVILPEQDGNDAVDYVFQRTDIIIDEAIWMIDYSFLGGGYLDADLTFNWYVVTTNANGVQSRYPQSKTFTAGSYPSWDMLVRIEQIDDYAREVYIEKSTIVYNGAYNIIAPDWK